MNFKILIIPLLSIGILYSIKSLNELIKYYPDRDSMVTAISDYYANEAAARCWCRIGNDRGYKVKTYENPKHDFGSLKRWGGPLGRTNKREGVCQELCREKIYDWLNDMTTYQLCAILEETGVTDIVGYSKVGGGKWIRTLTKEKTCPEQLAKCRTSHPNDFTNFTVYVNQQSDGTFPIQVRQKCSLPPGWNYYWSVCKVNYPDTECIQGTEAKNPSEWWTPHVGHMFDGYIGAETLGDTNEKGKFELFGHYKIKLGIFGDNIDWTEKTLIVNRHGVVQ